MSHITESVRVNRKKAANELREQSLNAGHSEKLIPGKENFKLNDPYKVSYRFISNACLQWRDLGLTHFPKKWEVIQLAQMADPYFEWLFCQEDGIGQFKRLYEFHEDVWNDSDDSDGGEGVH